MDYVNLLNNYKGDFGIDDIKKILDLLLLSDPSYQEVNSIRELISVDPENIIAINDDDKKVFDNKTLPTALMVNDIEHVRELIGATSTTEVNQRLGAKDVEYIKNLRRKIIESIILLEDGRYYYSLSSSKLFPNVEEFKEDNNNTKFRIVVNAPGSNNFILLSEVFKELVDKKIPFNIRTRIIDDISNIGYTDSLVIESDERVFNTTCDIVKNILENNKELIRKPNGYIGMNVDDLFGLTIVEQGSEDYYSPMEAIVTTIEEAMHDYNSNNINIKTQEFGFSDNKSKLNDLRLYLGLFFEKNTEEYNSLLSFIMTYINGLKYDLSNPFVKEVAKEEFVAPVIEEYVPQTENKSYIDDPFLDLYKDKDEELTQFNVNEEQPIVQEIPPMEENQVLSPIEPVTPIEDSYTPVVEEPITQTEENIPVQPFNYGEEVFNWTPTYQEEVKDTQSEPVTEVSEIDTGMTNEVANNQFDANKFYDLDATLILNGLNDALNKEISTIDDKVTNESVEEATPIQDNNVEETISVQETKKSQPIIPDEYEEEKEFKSGNNYGINNGNTAEIKIDPLELSKKESTNLADSLNKTESEILGDYANIISYETAIQPVCVSVSGTTKTLIDYLNEQDVINKIKLDSVITDLEGNRLKGEQFIRDVVVPLFIQNSPEHLYTIEDIISERTRPTEEQVEQKQGFFSRLFGRRK